jgi:hypothetical protein
MFIPNHGSESKNLSSVGIFLIQKIIYKLLDLDFFTHPGSQIQE